MAWPGHGPPISGQPPVTTSATPPRPSPGSAWPAARRSDGPPPPGAPPSTSKVPSSGWAGSRA